MEGLKGKGALASGSLEATWRNWEAMTWQPSRGEGQGGEAMQALKGKDASGASGKRGLREKGRCERDKL